MPRDIEYCFNHSDVAAYDKCAQCKKAICFNCAKEIFSRTFCTTKCASIFALASIGRWIIKMITGLIRGIRSPFILLKKIPPKIWVFVLILFTGFYFINKMSREIKYLKKEISVKQKEAETVDTTKIAPFAEFTPTEGGMVHANQMDIVGEVEENRIVSLSIDGKLTQVLLPQTGRFEFKGIHLHRGQNHLEVRAITQDGRVSILQTLDLMYSAPMLPYLVKELTRGSLNRKEVAVTFDGGSIDNATQEILEILQEKKIKCTFFLTGEFIRSHPKTVKQIVANGHEVGNHTWSHSHMTSFAKDRKQTTLPAITRERIRDELSKTASIFKLVTGREMAHLWRAPYGEVNQEILRWAAEAGYKHVGWTMGKGAEETMDTMDWVADKNSNAYRTADAIASKILDFSKKGQAGASGAIILMHLGTNRTDDFPHKKLPDIITGLQGNGYKLVTISEMAEEL